MVRKLALTSLFLSDANDVKAPCSPPSMSAASWSTAASWQWPSCTQARTMSFGRDDDDDGCSAERSSTSRSRQEDVYRTSVMNPAYCFVDSAHHSCLSTNSSASTASEAPAAPAEVDEVIIRGLRSSSRLFFEPEATSSIVKTAAAADGAAFGGATAMAIDSADPYGDFRRSMEEMVMSRGGASDDWGWLEEMLGWYLRANGKKTHGLIVGAFVDLLVALTSSSSSATFAKQSDEC